MSCPDPARRAYLGELYRRYAPLVFRRARRLLADEQAARDATQEVFMRMLDAFPSPGGTPPPVAWLYRVTTNHCLNVLRDGKRRQALIGLAGQAAPRSAEVEVPVSLLLRGVPADVHEVAIYYYIDEMSQAEIAEVLGVSQRTVSTRLSAFKGALERAWRPAAEQVS
jgi:RNA polymerase sigma-70 factor (ECF subfamily)